MPGSGTAPARMHADAPVDISSHTHTNSLIFHSDPVSALGCVKYLLGETKMRSAPANIGYTISVLAIVLCGLGRDGMAEGGDILFDRSA